MGDEIVVGEEVDSDDYLKEVAEGLSKEGRWDGFLRANQVKSILEKRLADVVDDASKRHSHMLGVKRREYLQPQVNVVINEDSLTAHTRFGINKPVKEIVEGAFVFSDAEKERNSQLVLERSSLESERSIWGAMADELNSVRLKDRVEKELAHPASFLAHGLNGLLQESEVVITEAGFTLLNGQLAVSLRGGALVK